MSLGNRRNPKGSGTCQLQMNTPKDKPPTRESVEAAQRFAASLPALTDNTISEQEKAFKSKWFCDAFYWVGENNYEPLQKIAFEMGLKWHTGDVETSKYSGLKNLVMFPDGKIQSVDFWHPSATYGEPKSYREMIAEYTELKKLQRSKPTDYERGFADHADFFKTWMQEQADRMNETVNYQTSYDEYMALKQYS